MIIFTREKAMIICGQRKSMPPMADPWIIDYAIAVAAAAAAVFAVYMIIVEHPAFKIKPIDPMQLLYMIITMIILFLVHLV